MRTGAPALLLGVAAVVVVFADRLGIDQRTPFVQLIAFRPQLAAGLVVLAVVVVLLSRRSWPVAVALGVVGLLGLVAVAPRVAGTAPTSTTATSTAPTGTAATGTTPTVDVLEANTYLGRADPGALAAVVRARRPAVVVLPEAN